MTILAFVISKSNLSQRSYENVGKERLQTVEGRRRRQTRRRTLREGLMRRRRTMSRGGTREEEEGSRGEEEREGPQPHAILIV